MSEGGWFDSEAIEAERFDADMEMAALEAAGRRASRVRKAAKALFIAGDLDGAAKACAHRGGGYPLNSIAASNDGDPRSGQGGVRCHDCGSAVTCFAWDGKPEVIAACEFKPFAR